MTRIDYHGFIARYWHGDTTAWFADLADAGLTAFDWPAPFGLDWSREMQLAFVNALSAARCPLMPESLSLIAPLLLHAGTPAQQRACLPRLRLAPLEWQFNQNAADCVLVQDDSLLLITAAPDSQRIEPLGQPGKADAVIAGSFSPALMLHEFKTGVCHLKTVNSENEYGDFSVREAAADALFLQATWRADLQLALLLSRSRLDLFSELFSALGYYALLDPDPVLSDNEPVPFAEERNYLTALRKLTARNEMLQQDAIFEACLETQ